MINKNSIKIDIAKALYENGIINHEIYEKCSTPKFFTNKTRKTFDAFAKETQDWNHEKALYVDNDGNILWEKEGNGNSVSIDESTAWNLSDPHETAWHPSKGIGYAQINLEHNHPTIQGFEAMPPLLSMGDTHSLLKYANEGYLFRSITAEANGKRMSLIHDPSFDGETSMHHGNFDRKKYESACDNLDKSLTKYIKMYGAKLAEFNGMDVDELSKKLKSGEVKTNYDISQRALDEIGSLNNFLEKEGVVKEMNDCGINILLEE